MIADLQPPYVAIQRVRNFNLSSVVNYQATQDNSQIILNICGRALPWEDSRAAPFIDRVSNFPRKSFRKRKAEQRKGDGEIIDICFVSAEVINLCGGLYVASVSALTAAPSIEEQHVGIPELRTDALLRSLDRVGEFVTKTANVDDAVQLGIPVKDREATNLHKSLTTYFSSKDSRELWRPTTGVSLIAYIDTKDDHEA